MDNTLSRTQPPATRKVILLEHITEQKFLSKVNKYSSFLVIRIKFEQGI